MKTVVLLTHPPLTKVPDDALLKMMMSSARPRPLAWAYRRHLRTDARSMFTGRSDSDGSSRPAVTRSSTSHEEDHTNTRWQSAV